MCILYGIKYKMRAAIFKEADAINICICEYIYIYYTHTLKNTHKNFFEGINSAATIDNFSIEESTVGSVSCHRVDHIYKSLKKEIRKT